MTFRSVLVALLGAALVGAAAPVAAEDTAEDTSEDKAEDTSEDSSSVDYGRTKKKKKKDRRSTRYGPRVLKNRQQALKEDLDRDGIPDKFDRCPGQREDFDGFQDHDGCPE